MVIAIPIYSEGIPLESGEAISLSNLYQIAGLLLRLRRIAVTARSIRQHDLEGMSVKMEFIAVPAGGILYKMYTLPVPAGGILYEMYTLPGPAEGILYKMYALPESENYPIEAD